MNYQSRADLGGQAVNARVVPELTLAMGATGAWNIDMSRSARET